MIKKILWLVSFLVTIPVYDKYWAPFDEGIVTVAAQRLIAGQVPYKDFFIAMYPPGQIYILEALSRFFSHPLIAARIYAVLISVVMTMLVFFIVRLLTKNLAVSVFSWLIILSSLGPRLGTIPSPIWPGVMLGLLSIYIFMKYLINERGLYIFGSGLICGLAATFRHDIGIFACLAVLLTILTRGINIKNAKALAFFLLGILFITIPWILYLVNLSAGKDLYNSLIAFTFVHQKTASFTFPKPCFDLNMIFHGSLAFIYINQFYIPILIYAATIPYLLRRRLPALLVIFIFGILTFNQVRIRPDPAHLLTVIAPAIILFGYMLHDTFVVRKKGIFRYAFCIFMSILLALLFIKNADKYMKNTYTKVMKKEIIKTDFDKGAIYVPKDEREGLLKTIDFIKNNTAGHDKIYIGNIVHWKDDFGGSLILYYLADRLPSTKYYELLPGLIRSPEVQKEIAQSLESNSVKLVVLQDVDTGDLCAEDAPPESRILDEYIRRHYRLSAKFGKYGMYKRE